MPHASVTSLPGFVTDLAEAHVVTPSAIAKTALRYEGTGADHLLAHIASGGSMDLPSLLTAAKVAAAGTIGSPVEIDPSLRAPGLYGLAFLTMGRVADPADVARAADLFALARRVAERDGVPTEHPNLDMQTSLACGRREYVRTHLATSGADPWVRWAVESDLLHPGDNLASAGMQAWSEHFNEPFVSRGIAPVRYADPASPFDSVTTDAPAARAGIVGGPLVSIVMPVFKPSRSLLTAVGSLVRQTWRNVQVIVVDDASPVEYEPIFDAVRALDDRVEYLRMPTNGGAYRARNRGIAHASGEFVGIQDGDDWSHPQRIERQMREFDRDPALVATMSKAIRLYSDLRITKVGSLPFEKNAPSLIFRRELVTARLGPFDVMRKAADSEYIERIAAAFGSRAVLTLQEPLSLYQLTDGSLSRADFRLGWHRDARVSYHAAFRHWHRSIVEDGADPVVESPTGRSFPAPPEIAGTSYPETPPDVVVLADWRDGLVTSAGLPAEVSALVSSGLTVGLARGEAMRMATVKRGYASRQTLQLLAQGTATWAPLGAALTPHLLLIGDPDLMAFARDTGAVSTRPGRVAIIADREPEPAGRPRLSYDPAHVEDVVRRLFDCDTEWLPATEEISEALVAGGASGHRHPPHLTEIVTVSPFPFRPVQGRPVIGVSDASTVTAERARRADLMTLLPTGATFDVRILESTTGPRHPGHPGWLHIGRGVVTATKFFDQCDFYVGLPPKVAGPGLIRPIVEAMARGCVPIVHEIYRPFLGGAALYYGERTVAHMVDEMWHEPERFAAQQAAALAFCRNELSASAFASAVTQLVGMDTPT